MKDKIVIIGAGFVGSTIAYAVMNWGLTSEIVLIDVNEERAEGEAMDLSHGASFVKPVNVKSGDYKECSDARAIVITAGAKQEHGESRLDLIKKNTVVFKNIIPKIMKYTTDTVLIVVTNPVDILTYVTLKLSDLPYTKVIGSGTVLDTSRFRYLLSKYCKVNPRNVHAYIIGEHGDSEVAAWSLTNIAGIQFDEYCNISSQNFPDDFKDIIYNKVRESAYEVIKKKNATYFAVGLSVARIIESIFRDENSVLTVSSVLRGEYGLNGVAMSLPHVIGIEGIKDVLPLNLSTDEKNQFLHSADILTENISKLNIDF